MSSRTPAVLDRFPRHLDADGRGKAFGAVVDALAGGLDVQASQVGRVRRAHRLLVTDEARDLGLLGDLHDLSATLFRLLDRRLAAVRAVANTLDDPATTEDEAEQAEASLRDLLGVAAGALAAFPDAAALLPALAALAGYSSQIELARRLVLDVIGAHRDGNGSVFSVLRATSAYLHLEIEGSVTHSADRFWHLARCRDGLRLRQDPDGAATLLPLEDLVAVEENPFRSHEVFPSARRHGERFSVFRRGWDDVAVTVAVTGVEERTVGPMIVNLDSGAGVAFTGTVPAGSQLRFVRDGRVQLDGGDVAGRCYSFHGAVFADAAASHSKDFVWAGPGSTPAPGGRGATFAVTAPIPDAFDETAAFPHSGGRLTSPAMSTGESRWAYLVAKATFGSEEEGGRPWPAAPRFRAGRFDATVWAATTGVLPPSGEVGFEWQEHEPFAARVWIPMRFAALDRPDEVPVREQVRLLLERHRPAGVHLYVDYADDRWTLGEGLIRPPDSTAPDGVVVAGTRLWPYPPAAPLGPPDL